MRSYLDHLQSLGPSPANFSGVFRASALFAVIEKEGISSRILFMGYWMLKRGISEIGQVASLRSKEGKLLARRYLAIREAKAFRIEVQDLLPKELKGRDFEGSLEVEFFSSSNLVFPYPAAVINYYGPAFSTVVHTAQRVYNNHEDLLKNSETSVKESGFNLWAEKEITPFVSLVNGPEPQPAQTLKLEAINFRGEELDGEIALKALAPYERVWLHPAENLPLKEFFKGEAGACKLSFSLTGVFPRLVAGNETSKALTITHTYYDCSSAASFKDYWHEENPLYHPATLMIPVDLEEEAFTHVYFYPIYSPSKFAIDLELYEPSGRKIFEKSSVVEVAPSKEPFQKIDFGQLGLPEGKYGCRLIARRLGEEPIPSRIKVALDMGSKNRLTPCNICTNLQPYSAKIGDKKSSFKWAPVLADQPRSTLWILNSAPDIHFDRPATVDLKFHRESDSAVLERPLILPPHGFIEIETENDPELKAFFQGEVGWATLVSSNPFLTTFYFAINPSGCVGGDHGF